jgi:hypothetical protein
MQSDVQEKFNIIEYRTIQSYIKYAELTDKTQTIYKVDYPKGMVKELWVETGGDWQQKPTNFRISVYFNLRNWKDKEMKKFMKDFLKKNEFTGRRLEYVREEKRRDVPVSFKINCAYGYRPENLVVFYSLKDQSEKIPDPKVKSLTALRYIADIVRELDSNFEKIDTPDLDKMFRKTKPK